MSWRGRDRIPTEAGKAPGAGLPRRALLQGLASGGAAAAVAASGPAGAEQEPQTETSDDPRRLEYRETEHVRWFYQRARM